MPRKKKIKKDKKIVDTPNVDNAFIKGIINKNNQKSPSSFEELEEKEKKKNSELDNAFIEGIINENNQKLTFSFKELEEIQKKKNSEVVNTESVYITTLDETRVVWVKKQNQLINLKQSWSDIMIALLFLQTIVLLILITFGKDVVSENALKLYIGGVFVELLVIPKQIANHLFPNNEVNHTSEILRILIDREKKAGNKDEKKEND